jgi:hypothetical protein
VAKHFVAAATQKASRPSCLVVVVDRQFLPGSRGSLADRTLAPLKLVQARVLAREESVGVLYILLVPCRLASG